MNRRHWLKLVALASTGVAARRSLTQTNVPHLRVPADPRHRIAIATYPFRAVITAPGNTDRIASKPGISLAEFAAYIRTTFNVFGIEPLHSHFSSTAPADIAKLRRAFDASNVRTLNIAVDAPADLCSPDPAIRAKGVDVYRMWVDIAVQLASPSIRIGSIPRCTDSANLLAVADALRPVVAYAASRSILVMLENDDPQTGSATRIAGIVRGAASPWLRGLPDFGNGLIGGDVHFNAKSVREMFQVAGSMAHVKEGETIQGKDVHISLPELFTIARQAGYRGFYSMESDSGADPERNTKYLVEQTLALM